MPTANVRCATVLLGGALARIVQEEVVFSCTK